MGSSCMNISLFSWLSFNRCPLKNQKLKVAWIAEKDTANFVAVLHSSNHWPGHICSTLFSCHEPMWSPICLCICRVSDKNKFLLLMFCVAFDMLLTCFWHSPQQWARHTLSVVNCHLKLLWDPTLSMWTWKEANESWVFEQRLNHKVTIRKTSCSVQDACAQIAAIGEFGPKLSICPLNCTRAVLLGASVTPNACALQKWAVWWAWLENKLWSNIWKICQSHICQLKFSNEFASTLTTSDCWMMTAGTTLCPKTFQNWV